MSPLSDTCFTNLIFQSVVCLFSFITESFEGQQILIWGRPTRIICSQLLHIFCFQLKATKIFCNVFPGSFIALALKFRFMIHFKFCMLCVTKVAVHSFSFYSLHIRKICIELACTNHYTMFYTESKDN